jgi:hypothetical protein
VSTVRWCLVGVALAALSCGRAKITADECGAMLDRYLDMTITLDPAASDLPPAQAQLARDARKDAQRKTERYREIAGQCAREVTRGEYDCAMKAPSANQWEACIE